MCVDVRGKFGGSSSSSEAKRASAREASEGEGEEGSLAKRTVCARVEKKSGQALGPWIVFRNFTPTGSPREFHEISYISMKFHEIS